MNDLRFACRQLLKNPGFTAVAVLTLALGIGANTAIFSVIDAVLLKTLPVRNPGELLALHHAGGDRRGNGFAYPVFERLRDENRAFSRLFAFSTWPESTTTINGREEPLPGGVLLVSGEYHAGLGIRPWLGRLISPEDNRNPGGHPVAVLSYAYWQGRFGGSPAAIGQPIALNGTPFTIIGVTPPEFFGVRVGRSDSITVPIMMQPLMLPRAPFLRDSGNWDVEILGRLKPELSEIQATAGLRVLFQLIELESVGSNPSPERLKVIQDRRIDLKLASHGLSALRQQFSEPLRILLAVSGLVLLIACANVAGLLLARASMRRQEIAVRLALGASRVRLLRQLLTESALLAVLGGAAGLAIAMWLGGFCVSLIPDRAGSIDLDLQLDGRMLAFTTVVSIFTGIAFGLVPAWQATRIGLAPTLKAGANGISQSPRHFWLGRGLVAGQVALSLMLLVGAGLFLRTFQTLRTVDPGFVSENLLLFSLDSRMRGSSPEEAFDLLRQLLARINTVPGIVSATVSRDGNFGGGGRTRTTLTVPGEAAAPARDLDVLDVPVGPRFFETFGMPLLGGREFAIQDDARAPKVAVINETAARHFFGSQNPIGQRIGVGTAGDTIVVGVVRDAKLNTLRDERTDVVYRPFLQSGPPRRMTFAIRTAVPPLSILGAVRRELDAQEPHLPVFEFRTLQDVIARSLAQERLFATLSSLFALVALALVAVGLYGVMACSVGQRTREIGLRIALGAGSRSVLTLVIVQAIKVVLSGVTAGAILAFGLTRFTSGRLYGISAADPVAFAFASVLLVCVALLACYLPARRASRVDPMEALRAE